MSYGKANNILRKNIMFDLVCKLKANICFHCNLLIESVNDFSIEHKKSWMYSDDPVKYFFDLENISFSHLKCNVGNSENHFYRNKIHKGYASGCRCDECRVKHNTRLRNYFRKKRLQKCLDDI